MFQGKCWGAKVKIPKRNGKKIKSKARGLLIGELRPGSADHVFNSAPPSPDHPPPAQGTNFELDVQKKSTGKIAPQSLKVMGKIAPELGILISVTYVHRNTQRSVTQETVSTELLALAECLREVGLKT